MEWLVDTFRDMETSQKILYVVGGVVVAGISALIIGKLLYREKRKVYPRNTVILHQIGRGPYAPSMTPFAIKLETYLRIAKIPYQNVHDHKRSSKGKFPWIEYNDEIVADSTLCIDYLNKKLGIDLNKHLRPAEKGIAQSMKVMTEEHLYWCLVLFRWVYDNDKTFLLKMFKYGKFFLWRKRRKVMKNTWVQGMGRHTEGEIIQMMKRDFQALSDFLGEKKFLFGDVPCEADCAVFGQLAELYWHFLGTGFENEIKDNYSNLAAYCERMKTTFWPDWNQCITHGRTREATK